MELKVYNDAGHGWIAAKRNLLVELGIAHKVSSYSYQNGQTVYLEEDLDAALLLDALKMAGVAVTFKESYRERSHIRSYPHYAP